MASASACSSLFRGFSLLLLPAQRPRLQSRAINLGFPKSLRVSLPRGFSSHAGPVAAVPDGMAFADVVEKDWSFLEAAAAGGSVPRALAAGALSPASRVLVVTPAPAFVNAVLSGNPCELLVAAHESLYVLAGIKELHDEARCFHLEGGGGGRGGGVVEAVPERFNAFDAVFVCYFPGMGVSAAALLKSLAKRCAKGARVVIFLDQGRQNLEQHRREHPEVVTSDLPSRPSLEKATAGSMFEIVEFVDEPALYLAVLQLQE
ncbi:hypothetical protein GUJ93_ZPchr0013g37451 [Zizania palustris]|uniref:Uncharacterized protein n=1 Tax=Zizania palustris TaxID=103762 RepID=A0A8J5WTN4_ZIZPA|nr:hypothetical protein GUJ93_ZPchr0013g37451 [Zizania palustris]